MGRLALIGISFSILLSIILILFGIDEPASIIIGLCVTVIALVLDVLSRLDRAEKRLVEVARLNYDLTRNADLLGRIVTLVDDYLKVTVRGRSEFFADRARSVLAECADGLHHLAEGHMNVAPLSEFSFGLRGLSTVTTNIRATSYVDAESFWKSVAGERYFQLNLELIKRGITITRVFIGDRATLNRSRAFIERQRAAKINVLLAPTEDTRPELWEDYLIADDTTVTHLTLTREGVAQTERISIEPNEVRRSVNNFNRLIADAYGFEEFFQDADG